MADPYIALQFRPAQIESPMQLQQQGLNLRNLAQQTQINQQRIQQETMRSEQMDRQKRDMQTIQREFNNPQYLDQNGTLDWDRFRSSIAPKVSYPTLQKLDADHLEQQRAYAAKSAADKVAMQTSNQLIGQEVAGLLQTPPEQRLAAAQQAIARLQKGGVDMSGFSLTPDHLTDDNLNAMAMRTGYIGNLISWDQKQQMAAKNKALAAADQAKADSLARQQAREDAARSYLTVTDQAGHDRWLQNLPDSIKGEYSNLTAYTPDNQDILDKASMTGQQRSVDYRAQQRIDNSPAGLARTAADDTQPQDVRDRASAALRLLKPINGKQPTAASLAAAAYDPTKSDTDRQAASQALAALRQRPSGFNSAQADKDAKQFSQYQIDEQTQWGIVSRYRAALAAAKGSGQDSFNDPVNPAKSITEADANAIISAAQNKINTLHDAADQILKNHQWGKYAPAAGQQQGGGAAAPGAPAPPSGGQPQKKYTEAQIRQWAKDTKRDPEAAVQAARAKNLIQ